MDYFLSIYFGLFTSSLGIVFLTIMVSRFVDRPFLRLFKRLEKASRNILFQRLFWILGILAFIFLSVSLNPDDLLYAIITGAIAGFIYLFMMFSVIRLLHHYIDDID